MGHYGSWLHRFEIHQAALELSPTGFIVLPPRRFFARLLFGIEWFVVERLIIFNILNRFTQSKQFN